MTTFKAKHQNYAIITQLEKTLNFIAKTELSIEQIELLLQPNSLLRKYIALYQMNDQLDQALLNNSKLMNEVIIK
jgi:hypothetical protein